MAESIATIASLTPIINNNQSKPPNVKRAQPKQQTQLLLSPVFIPIVISCSLLLMLQSSLATLTPDFGPLYDCKHVYETNLYKFESHINCSHKMHLSKAKVR